MKKTLILLLLTPLFANAQEANGGFNFNALFTALFAIAIVFIVFLAIRNITLWYFKIDTLVAYQEQNIKALQSIYNSQEELVKLTKEQTELLREMKIKGVNNQNNEIKK